MDDGCFVQRVDDGRFVIGCCWVDDGCCVQMMLLGG